MKKHLLIGLALALALLFSQPVLANEPQEVKVHFIDVGQADCIYIKLPNQQDILIDGGNIGDGPRVVEYLKWQKVDDLELVIATHAHEDHIGGLPDVFSAFAVERVIDSGHNCSSQICKKYLDRVKDEGCPYEKDYYGLYSFGSVSLQILTGPEKWQETNDYSVVCKLDTGDIEFLFTGDAEDVVEKQLSGPLEAEILKVGHHGSDSSTSQDFLSQVNPKVAIISVGTENKYGHPAPETLERLKNAGLQIYRTDQQGTIVITTNGKEYTISTEKAS